jgi:cysteinyl-tRNA synthetase
MPVSGLAVLDGKDDPLDFVLWKSAKADEPPEVKWDSAYGAGRPGWHIECSAMACELLGQSFDIHGGGADLQFPHHENEIAQSEGAHGHPMARIWMHNGFINVDNVKMSKSLNNFFTIREVLKLYAPEVVRFFVVRSHYRSALNFSDVHLDDARSSLKRLYTALQAVKPDELVIDWQDSYAARFKVAMDEDFGTQRPWRFCLNWPQRSTVLTPHSYRVCSKPWVVCWVCCKLRHKIFYKQVAMWMRPKFSL